MCVAHSGCSIHFSPMLCQEKLQPARGLMSPRPNVSAVGSEALSQTATQRQQNRVEDHHTWSTIIGMNFWWGRQADVAFIWISEHKGAKKILCWNAFGITLSSIVIVRLINKDDLNSLVYYTYWVHIHVVCYTKIIIDADFSLIILTLVVFVFWMIFISVCTK